MAIFFPNFAAAAAVVASCATPCAGLAAEPPQDRVCYSASDTRDKIEEDGLFEPFQTMRSVASTVEAEAIGAKLCRRSDELVYEISLLRRDGHVVRIIVDARTGQTVPGAGR